MKIDDRKIIALDSEDEPQFRWRGCDNCDNGLGCMVYECEAFPKEGLYKVGDYYEIFLCGPCLRAYHYGGGLDPECKNKFEV